MLIGQAWFLTHSPMQAFQPMYKGNDMPARRQFFAVV